MKQTQTNNNIHEVDYDYPAKIQLFHAIDLYKKEQYIPALTLAGAAEEWLNKILSIEKQAFPTIKNNLENQHSLENIEKVIKDVKDFKNKFKHGFTYQEFEKKGVFQFDVLDLIEITKGYIAASLLNYMHYYETYDVKRTWPESFFEIWKELAESDKENA